MGLSDRVQSLSDVESDFVEALRSVVGERVMFAASFDLH